MPEDIQLAKKALRASIIAQRDSLDAALRREYSQLIAERVLALPEYRAARVVAAYASFGSELDTGVFLRDALATGKQLLLPRINRAARRLELRRAGNLDADLVAGVWGICEPAGTCPEVPARQVEFMLMPGVAFTMRGERLGYGGGFYDRLLTQVSPQTWRVAGAFDLQVVDDLPADAGDQRVHRIVTELQELDTGF